jgi:peptide/nickel transport system permease protein
VNRQVRRGLLAVAVLSAIGLLGPGMAPYDPRVQPDPVALRNAPPSLAHPLGTDPYSRDVLSRVLHGARISLVIAVLSVLLSVTAGTAVGLVAGFTGGPIDAVLMRSVDALLAIPRIFLLLIVAAWWEALGLAALIILLGLTSWFGTSRLVRASVLSVRTRDFVSAARSLGIGATRIVTRHVLPNVAGPILVTATLGVGQIVLIEAGLSYLGIGVRPPTPSLGSIIYDGEMSLATAPWTATAPGLVVVLTVLAFSTLGEGLRELLDPRSAA